MFARRTAVELPDEWCEGVGEYHAANGWRPKGLVLDQTRRRNQSSRFNRARRLRVLAVRAAFMFVTSASRTPPHLSNRGARLRSASGRGASPSRVSVAGLALLNVGSNARTLFDDPWPVGAWGLRGSNAYAAEYTRP